MPAPRWHPSPQTARLTFRWEINGNGYALPATRQSRWCPKTSLPASRPPSQSRCTTGTTSAYFAAYLDLPGSRAPYEDDTYVEYDGGTVQASDPEGIMSGESISIIQDPHNPLQKDSRPQRHVLRAGLYRRHGDPDGKQARRDSHGTRDRRAPAWFRPQIPSRQDPAWIRNRAQTPSRQDLSVESGTW